MEAGGPPWSPAILPWLWTGVLALVVQLFLIKVVGPNLSQSGLIVWAVFSSHLLLVPFLVRNMRHLGVRLILLGLSLNLLAMASNGGMMPVSASGIEAAGQELSLEPGDQIAGSKDVYATDPRLAQLSDRIVVRLTGHLVRVVSIGDIIIAMGTACALVSISTKVIRQGHSTNAEASQTK